MNASRKFSCLWAGQLLSVTGSGMSAFALGVHLLQKSGRSDLFAVLLLAQFLPSALLTPLGGVFADRFRRPVIMAISDLSAAAGIALMTMLYSLNISGFWPLFAAILITSICSAFHMPAYKASVSDLLKAEDYSRASAMMQLAEAARFLLAPAIAGVIISGYGLQAVFISDIATFVIAAAPALLLFRQAESGRASHETVLSDFRKGAGVLSSDRGLRNLILVIMLITFFTGILQALFLPMIIALTDAEGAGYIQTLAASGIIASGILISSAGMNISSYRILLISIFSSGLFFGLTSVSENLILITASAFAFFCTLPFINTCLEVLIRTQLNRDVQGRIWAMTGSLSQMAMLLAFASAWLYARMTPTLQPLLQQYSLFSGPGRENALPILLSGAGLMLTALMFSSAHFSRNKQTAAGSDSGNALS